MRHLSFNSFKCFYPSNVAAASSPKNLIGVTIIDLLLRTMFGAKGSEVKKKKRSCFLWGKGITSELRPHLKIRDRTLCKRSYTKYATLGTCCFLRRHYLRSDFQHEIQFSQESLNKAKHIGFKEWSVPCTLHSLEVFRKPCCHRVSYAFWMLKDSNFWWWWRKAFLGAGSSDPKWPIDDRPCQKQNCSEVMRPCFSKKHSWRITIFHNAG